jgi:tungstate transport system ATP-binding protein
MPEGAGPILECRGVRQRYGKRTVLTLDDLVVGGRERLAIVGPNGAGKSTLLRILAFLETPVEGTLALAGTTVGTAAARRAARRRVTLVEQRPFLFRGPVLANVAYGLRARGLTRLEAEREARNALAQLQAQSLEHRDAAQLSGGEAQRVAVARALACAPDVLLLDEPVSGADRAAQHSLYAAIVAAQARRPMAVCVATHQLEDAYRWSDRILALHEGTPAPVTPENIFRVDLPGGGPMQQVRVGDVTFDVVSDRSGPATLAIPPEEIVLSLEPLHSSARNRVAGRVIRVAEQGAAMRVTLEGGVELVALVTRRSFEDLGLAVGRTVYASFKSVAVRVF